MELAESSGRSLGSSAASDGRSCEESNGDDKDEVELMWAAIERLPTPDRARTSLFDDKTGGGKRVTDVTKLGAVERHVFIEQLLKKVEDDNLRLLLKLRDRIHRVGLELPTVEVRYQNLSVEAECEAIHGGLLPTLWGALKSILRGNANLSRTKSRIKILKDVSGIIKPSRMTLLLGPPGSGKSTFLLALAGKLDQSLKVEGDITYNGYKLDEFVPQKTSSYISQYDLHISQMSVRETLDFSARCQGTGNREEILMEVSRREKPAGIIPEAEIDTFMKATSINGLRRSLQTDYILKILGLEICAGTTVGDAMRRGISGGQKKRLTTGEMMVGPTKVLFMDEISTGLDSSTTFQIVSCLQQLTHITESTILVSLLQPAPETFDLFDDIILMAEGKVAYHGPCDNVLEFLDHCGFRCPPRKGIADFIQEVVSKKDQGQYWYPKDQVYSYVSVDKFESKFKEFHVGRKQVVELSLPFNKAKSSRNALLFDIYSLRKWDLFRACLAREWLLMKRNSFVHVFKSVQLVAIAIVTMTVFIRTEMTVDMAHSNYFMGSMFCALNRLITNAFAELALTGSRLPVLYKQRDLYFYPVWSYSVPAAVLKLPFSFLDAFLWTVLTYYVIGYSPEPERFFCQLIIHFLVNQVSISQTRFIASVVRDPSAAVTVNSSALLVIFLFGGFIISKPSLPAWLEWGFWISPLTYGQVGVALNEFHAPRWQKVLPSDKTMGQEILTIRGINFNDYFYWISVGALLGFWIVFNIGFTFALSYRKAPGRSWIAVSNHRLSKLKGVEDSKNMTQGQESPNVGTSNVVTERKNKGMALPFEPLAISFENVEYYVETPKKLREQGFAQKRLQLLHDISGAFRPGVLSAVMGASGAGKTTLLDVLSGRKTSGIIDGEIRIGGYPKVQETYARISAYCEQTDIHSPHITIEESVTYSAWLRLPPEIDKKTKSEFIGEVLQMIELDEIKLALVGKPGVSGISNEQRKRLSIAVELVSNPSIIFMDEPTSGLDARAAAIVMRVVKNVVSTMRTVICTIHQPSIDIFETFDELIFLNRGGRIIYAGELGKQSSKLIHYFEEIPGVQKFNANRNPASWMLEVTSPSAEAQLGLDFAHLYKQSHLYWENKQLVRNMSLQTSRSRELKFSTQFPQNGWEQFKACLWKQHMSYWRNPKFNILRYILLIFGSVLFAALLWKKGQKMESEQEFLSVIGPIFILMQLLGIRNFSAILPVIVNERNVLYRERFAGMYSSWAHSLAQVTIEIPYALLQSLLFVAITYPAVNFYWSACKLIWYFYSVFCTFLYFTYFGMLIASLSPTLQVASVLSSVCFNLLNLFAGFIIPGPQIPKWWIWSYWICPASWSLKAVVTSQYGDINKEISVYGEPIPINAFLRSYFGYHRDSLGLVAFVLFFFPLFFALAFAFFIEKLNFQRR